MRPTMDGQIDALEFLKDLERSTRIVDTGGMRNGLMLDIADPAQIQQYSEDWNKQREGHANYIATAPFHGFSPTVWDAPIKENGHDARVFLSDLRCVCWIGWRNQPRIDNCSCVGDWYERVYCSTCKWWSPILVGHGKKGRKAAEAHTSQPQFTAYTGEERHGQVPCSWCGRKGSHNEGGGGPATDLGPAWSYAVCNKCEGQGYRRPNRDEWRYEIA